MAINYGPYYLSSIRKAEAQKKALGGRAYTPEELAGLAYGELSSKYEQVRRRETEKEQLGIQKEQLGLQREQFYTGARTARKAAEAKKRGDILTGISTGINILGKVGDLGIIKAGGRALSRAGLIPAIGVKRPTLYETPGSSVYKGDLGPGFEAADYPQDWTGSIYESADYPSDWTGSIYEKGVEAPITSAAEESWGWFSGRFSPIQNLYNNVVRSISSGTVICTELYRQGLIDEKTYLADSSYGALLDAEVLIGYHLWAEKIADKMKTSAIFTKIVSLFAIPWAKEMAFKMGVGSKGHILGKIMNKIGIPVCGFIGKIMIGGKLKWQIG